MAQRFRFTQKALDELSTTRSREWVYDEQVQHLAVMVTAKGAKSFYVVKFVDGRKEEVRIGSYPLVSIPVARRLAAEILLQVVKGESIGSERRLQERTAQVTLQVAYDEYCQYLERHRKPRTIREYQNQWNRFLVPWAMRPLRSLRRKEVVALHQAIGDNHGKHQANRVVALLRAVINRAIREHELEIHNPAHAITFYREEGRTRRLSVEELPAFFQAVDEEPNKDIRDFVLLALFTGARKSNLLAMRWTDVSMDQGLWVIPAAESKTSKQLDVVLPTAALQILQDRLATRRGDFVFPGREGGQVSDNPDMPRSGHLSNPSVGWERILERAGLVGLRMHDLRRSLASFQIDTGTPLEVIQKTLGHESKMTTEIYARLAMEPVRASVERATEEMLRSRKKDSGPEA
ncbi:MAG: site-specific integrase [Candidatus Delongbacteria bacterium]